MAGNQGHRSDWISTFPLFWTADEHAFEGAATGYAPSGDTVIGSDVWIGSEAVIMPGVRIGHGAVIGTRALVTRDVGPYEIVGGNPAKVIRKRFDDASIAMLLEMQWWDWNEVQMRSATPILTSGNIDALHRYWREVVLDAAWSLGPPA